MARSIQNSVHTPPRKFSSGNQGTGKGVYILNGGVFAIATDLYMGVGSLNTSSLLDDRRELPAAANLRVGYSGLRNIHPIQWQFELQQFYPDR